MATIFPTSREESMLKNIPLYYVPERCEVCNAYAHKRYITDDKCRSCITKEATATIIMMKCLEGENDHVIWETQEIWVSPNITEGAKPWKLPNDVWERVIETAMMLNDNPSLTPTFDACSRHSHIKIKTPTGACYYCHQMAQNTPRKVAQRTNQPTYQSTNNCITCGSTERRTDTSQCSSCKPVERSLTPRQIALRDNQPTYRSTKPCVVCESVERSTKTSTCATCHPVKYHASGLSPRQQAIKNGDMFFIPDTPCKVCNTLSKRRVNNSQCTNCERGERTVSPRQQAIKNGEDWYMPNKPCSKCGTRSLKRVNNGVCKGC